jgi:hypothetical protein
MVRLFSRLLLLAVVFVSLFSFFITAQAAEFAQPDKEGRVVMSETIRDNYFAFGQRVEITGKTFKDLTVAAQEVIISAPNVGRNLVAVGQTVTVDNSNVIGSAMLAGGTVTLSGNFFDDVMVTGADVRLENAVIHGDLIVSSGKLTVSKSSINGDLWGEYGSYTGDDLDAQVKGQLKVNQGNATGKQDGLSGALMLKLPWAIGSLVGLFLLAWVLARFQKLYVPSLRLNKERALDGVWGLAMVVIPALIFMVSFIVLAFLQTGLLLGIVYSLYALSAMYVPIYLSNIVKNTWTSKALRFRFLLPTIYVAMVLLSWVPVLGSLVVFLVSLANFGFLGRIFYGVGKKALLEKVKS